jgi:hypothetical protein
LPIPQALKETLRDYVTQIDGANAIYLEALSQLSQKKLPAAETSPGKIFL